MSQGGAAIGGGGASLSVRQQNSFKNYLRSNFPELNQEMRTIIDTTETNTDKDDEFLTTILPRRIQAFIHACRFIDTDAAYWRDNVSIPLISAEGNVHAIKDKFYGIIKRKIRIPDQPPFLQQQGQYDEFKKLLTKQMNKLSKIMNPYLTKQSMRVVVASAIEATKKKGSSMLFPQHSKHISDGLDEILRRIDPAALPIAHAMSIQTKTDLEEILKDLRKYSTTLKTWIENISIPLSGFIKILDDALASLISMNQELRLAPDLEERAEIIKRQIGVLCAFYAQHLAQRSDVEYDTRYINVPNELLKCINGLETIIKKSLEKKRIKDGRQYVSGLISIAEIMYESLKNNLHLLLGVDQTVYIDQSLRKISTIPTQRLGQQMHIPHSGGGGAAAVVQQQQQSQILKKISDICELKKNIFTSGPSITHKSPIKSFLKKIRSQQLISKIEKTTIVILDGINILRSKFPAFRALHISDVDFMRAMKKLWKDQKKNLEAQIITDFHLQASNVVFIWILPDKDLDTEIYIEPTTKNRILIYVQMKDLSHAERDDALILHFAILLNTLRSSQLRQRISQIQQKQKSLSTKRFLSLQQQYTLRTLRQHPIPDIPAIERIIVISRDSYQNWLNSIQTLLTGIEFGSI